MVNEIHDQQASSFVLGHHCTSLGLVAMLRAIRQQRLKNHPENSQIMYKVLNPLHVKTDALNNFQGICLYVKRVQHLIHYLTIFRMILAIQMLGNYLAEKLKKD